VANTYPGGFTPASYILSENAAALRGQVFLIKKLLEDGTRFLLGA